MRLTFIAAAFWATSAAGQTMAPPQSTKASADPSAYGAPVKEAYARVRAATAPFHKLEAAVAAGYAATVPECFAHATHGGMGYHHVNRGYLDRTLDVERPEILLYERRADGSYALNGVEYIVPFRAWPGDSVPPRIMGRPLARSPELELWYMHMWVWNANTAGLFADYNPAVHCREPAA